jgi:hypothetical protein
MGGWPPEAASKGGIMQDNLAVSLDRADELLKELLAEYTKSLDSKEVSARATQLTHEVFERLRSVLDRLARLYWEKKIASQLLEDDRKAATVYFPIAADQNSFDSILGRWRWKTVRDKHQAIYEFLLGHQPFVNKSNDWLRILNDLAVQGKHIDLVPQTKTEERRITVEREGAKVSWNPAAVKFGGGPEASISVAGAPIDPRTQRIVPTPGVTERVETWVNFNIQGYGVNAAGFCTGACRDIRRLATEMSDKFGLS